MSYPIFEEYKEEILKSLNDISSFLRIDEGGGSYIEPERGIYGDIIGNVTYSDNVYRYIIDDKLDDLFADAPCGSTDVDLDDKDINRPFAISVSFCTNTKTEETHVSSIALIYFEEGGYPEFEELPEKDLPNKFYDPAYYD